MSTLDIYKMKYGVTEAKMLIKLELGNGVNTPGRKLKRTPGES